MMVLCSAKADLCYKRRWSKAVDSLRIAESIGLDTWGVDFALFDSQGALLSKPFHCRDEHTDGMLEETFRCMPPAVEI